VQEVCAEKIERDRKRGIRNRPVRAMITGIPNVGKSTFINTFSRKGAAKTGNKPGVTKGKQWIRLSSTLELLDTPGILWPKFEDQSVGIKLALIGSIKEDILNTEELALELIYCQDGPYRSAVAGFVRSELASAGVAVTAVPLSYADYVSRLNAGTYDLYLGEVRLTPNMDLFPLLAGGSAGYGVAPDGAAGTAYTGYREGSVTAEAFTSAFVQDMPYIPLCWRCGFAAYDRRLSTVTPHGYDPYYGFINWR